MRNRRTSYKQKPQGSHKPAMLQQQRRVLGDVQHSVPRRAQSGLFSMDSSTAVNRWHLLIILLLLSPEISRYFKLSTSNAESFQLYGHAVRKLNGAVCYAKTTGISTGKNCYVDGKLYYMKQFSRVGANETDAAASQHKSMAAQNRRFVADNIGARVPVSTFFSETKGNGAKDLFIAAEEVKNLKLAETGQLNASDLGEMGVARLAVTMTFIDDMHPKNWGVDQDGLVLIDVDAKEHSPSTVDAFLEIARKSLNNESMMPLSLKNIEEMLGIYQDMRSKDLPELPHDFHISKQLYQDVLGVYIKACQGAIDKIKHRFPGKQSDVPDYKHNQILVNRMYAQQQRSMKCKV